jgi:predicted dehydrogenase
MTIKWGFIGAGFVATKALAPAVHAASNATLTAVASQNLGRAQALAPVRTYHGSDSYNQVIQDPEIDAIYINLTNDQHYQWAIAALKAGKHVLCEKPLALNFQQSAEMADAATTSGKLLVEAVWTRWHPRFQRAVELVAKGDIGRLTAIESEFTFTADLKDNFRALKKLGGGSLLDVGGYQIQLWRSLINPWTTPTFTSVNQTLNGDGVDLATDLQAEIQLNEGLVKLAAKTSFIAPEKQSIKIVGDQSSIEFITGQAITSWNESSALRIGEHTEVFPPVDAYQIMIESFSSRISGGDNWVLPIQESLDVAKVLEIDFSYATRSYQGKK